MESLTNHTKSHEPAVYLLFHSPGMALGDVVVQLLPKDDPLGGVGRHCATDDGPRVAGASKLALLDTVLSLRNGSAAAIGIGKDEFDAAAGAEGGGRAEAEGRPGERGLSSLGDRPRPREIDQTARRQRHRGRLAGLMLQGHSKGVKSWLEITSVH